MYALMPSEQRVGLSDCEEVTGEFSNSWTGYQKPQKLYRRTVRGMDMTMVNSTVMDVMV